MQKCQEPNGSIFLCLFMKIILEASQGPLSRYQIVDFADQNQYIFYNISDPDLITLCEGCEENISNITKILTAGQEYCVACFAKLYTFYQDYRVMNALDFVLFEEGWTAEEELMIVEGIDIYGFDWDRIAIQMDYLKQARQIEQHYTQYYLSRDNCLPTILFDHIERVLETKQDKDELFTEINKQEQENKLPDNGMNPCTCSYNQQRQLRRRRGHKFRIKHHKNQINSSAIIGFTPKREQFQQQFDNQAQILLADMQFKDSDSQHLYELKMQVIMDYNKRIALRNSVKQFVISRKIIDLKYQTQTNHQKSQLQKEIQGMMKVFSRFSSPQNHQKIINGISKSLELQKRINFLKQMQRKGLTTFQQIDNQESAENIKASDYWNVQGLAGKGRTRRSLKLQNQLESKAIPKQNLCMLKRGERQLCQRLKLTELHYVMIRETIERNLLIKGKIKQSQLLGMFTLSPEIVKEIYRYSLSSQQMRSKLDNKFILPKNPEIKQ